MNKGKVYIIGVGPGDYKLITIRALECIKCADVIVYDRLVDNKILSFARDDAELVYVGKTPYRDSISQDEINTILVNHGLKGKIVARVKGGDPFVFGRGAEEAEFLLENGILFEVVPGITSAVAVPAYAGIPVTHRDYSSSIHIITGHRRHGDDVEEIDYKTLAMLKGTLVFLMGVKNIQTICSNLMVNGMQDTTPVAVVEKGTTSQQRAVTGTLLNISDEVQRFKIKSPAVIIVGGVAKLGEKLDWFSRGALKGKCIVVTRPTKQAESLVEKLRQSGARIIELPTIKITEAKDYSQLDKTLENVNLYNWIVFTSANGVEYFFGRMKRLGIDIRNLSGIKLAAIGQVTATKLGNLGLNVDVVPEEFTSEALLKELGKNIKKGERVLLARADIASQKLPIGLNDKGIIYDDIAVYKTVRNNVKKDEIIRVLEENEVDYITFTSPSTVEGFITGLGRENLNKLSGIKVVCIGPVTAEAAKREGLDVGSCSNAYTEDGLVDKLIEMAEVDYGFDQKAEETEEQ